MTRYIEGSISVLRCKAEGHLTPHLTFSGDTDMVTADLGSLSSVSADEVVVVELGPGELGDVPTDRFECRINALLDRDDLRFVRLRRVERDETPAGLSFQEYQKAYSSHRLIFACPRCGADSVAIRTTSSRSYEQSGGS
jgi:Zn finger protein HypA/HybF involved in hydrogenase expression